MVLAFVVSTAQAQTETIVFSTSGAWTTNYNGFVTITANYAINTSWKLTFTLPTNAVLGNAWVNGGSPNVGNVTTSNGAIVGSGTVNIPANTPFVINFGVSNVANTAPPTNFVFTNANKTGASNTAPSLVNCTFPSNIFPCNGNVGIGSFDATIQPKSPLHLQGTSFLHGTGNDNEYGLLFKRSNQLNGYQISEYAPFRNVMTFSNSQTSGMNNRPSVSIGESVNPYYRTFEVNGGHTGLYGTIGSDAASQQNLLQMISRRTNAISKVGGTHYLNFSHDLYPAPSNQEYSIINSHEYKDPSGPEAPKDLVLQNNNGNVGIGYYTAPLTEKLHVRGSIKLEGANAGLVFADGTKLSTASGAALWAKIGTTPDIQYGAGNVGIGIATAPTEKLQINGNIHLVGNLVGRRTTSTITLASNTDWTNGSIIELSGDNDGTNSKQGNILLLAGKGIGTKRGDINFASITGDVPSSSFATNMTIKNNGNIGIGTINPTEKLHIKGNIKVEGKIAAVEICANPTSAWCDYVFEPDYKLPSLASVQTFLTKYKHLPDVPSAAEVKENGYNMNKMDTALLKKLEEAYLYILDLEARVKFLEVKK